MFNKGKKKKILLLDKRFQATFPKNIWKYILKSWNWLGASRPQTPAWVPKGPGAWEGPKKQFLKKWFFDDLQIDLQTPSESLFVCHQKWYWVGGHPRKKLENRIFGPPQTS